MWPWNTDAQRSLPSLTDWNELLHPLATGNPVWGGGGDETQSPSMNVFHKIILLQEADVRIRIAQRKRLRFLQTNDVAAKNYGAVAVG